MKDTQSYLGLTQRPVGIGPVIAGQVNGKPAYFFDVALQNGETVRVAQEKPGRKYDRGAKNEAYRQRINLANELRPEVVLVHDLPSFEGLVSLLTQRAPRARHRLRAA